MFSVSKRLEIAVAHRLNLNYDSPCTNLHGHNLIVTVYCASPYLNSCSMVVDFRKIKELIHDKLDHKYLNEVLSAPSPTSEYLCKWIYEEINEYLSSDPYPSCYKVEVQESEGNIASYSNLEKFSSYDRDGLL